MPEGDFWKYYGEIDSIRSNQRDSEERFDGTKVDGKGAKRRIA